MNVGLIGSGLAANIHMLAYKHLEDVTVEAVSDINVSRAQALAKKYQISKSFSNYVDLLELRDLDVIDICTPTSTHATIACDAASYVNNILLEKPMARTTAECDKIISKCEKKKVSLCICHSNLFHPSVKKAKLSANNGYRIVRTIFSGKPVHSWVSKPEEGGPLWEYGAHQAYLQRYFLGIVKEVYAVAHNKSGHDNSDILAFLESANGSHGVMELSWTREFLEESLELYSLNEIERIDLAWFPKQEEFNIYRHDIPSSGKELAKRTVKGLKFALYLRTRVFETSIPFHFDLIRSYIKSIQDGTPPPVKPNEGKDAIRLLESVSSSLETGKRVRVQ